MSEFNDRVENFFKTYQDRGMKKWQGFFLSDHTQELEKVHRMENNVEYRRPGQQLDEISNVLFISFAQKRPVNIQLKSVNINGSFLPSIVAIVDGAQEESIIVDGHEIKLEEISSVEFL